VSRKARRIGFLFAGMIGLGAAIVYFVPSVTGSMIQAYGEKQQLSAALAACKPDEIVYVVFYHKYAGETATFSFTTKKLTGGDAEGGPPSLHGGPSSFYYNIQLGYGVTFTDDDIAEIKKLLAAMPEPIVPTIGTVSYRDELHLAFYRDGHQIIYHYPKFTAPSQLADLCKVFKITEHADQ
jgi:hypothetical protein